MMTDFSWSFFITTGSIEAFLLYTGCKTFVHSDHLIAGNGEEAAYG